MSDKLEIDDLREKVINLLFTLDGEETQCLLAVLVVALKVVESGTGVILDVPKMDRDFKS